MGISPQVTLPSPTLIMLSLILALVASAAAIPDPISLFETIDSLKVEGRCSGPALKDILQDQGVALAEETFDSSLSKSKCMAYELCMYGAEEVKDVEFTPAISAFTEFLTSMKETAARDTKNIDSPLARGSRVRPWATSAPASPSPAPCAASTPPRSAAPAVWPLASTAAPPATRASRLSSHLEDHDMNITCIIASLPPTCTK